MISCRDGRLSLALGLLLMAIVLFGASPSMAAAPAPAGRVVIAWHVTISPAWFDPSTAPPQITPFGMLYAIHDALVRPYPGQKMGPSLAESWEESEDGLTYQFKLRPGLQFHNGDPLTTEDVKFSFERYQGAGAQTLKDHVQEIEIVDPQIVRFHLKAPWPDFMTFYGTTATAAGIVVPKKYLTEIGDDGFKKHPVGAGPYKFVANKPGIEVELEAYPGYWRRVPNIKTLVMRSVPDPTTRALMLKTGEADMAYALDGVDAEGLKGDPGVQIVATKHASIFWIEFSEQWDPKSPWHDQRLRLAVNYALDRQRINEAACLGFCPPAGVIVPRVMDFALQAEPMHYDLPKAKQLLAEAGLSERPRRRRVHRQPRLPDRRGRVGRTTSTRPASAFGSGRWSAPPSMPIGARRNCMACSWSGLATPAMPPPASKPSSSRRAPTPMAAIPTSTNCSSSRPASATAPSARRSSTRSSN